MDKGDFMGGVVLGGIIGIVIGSLIGGSDVKDEYEEYYEDAVAQCEVVRDDYRMALRDAEESIEFANDQINDAQGYAWADYEDMGYMLESLEEVEEADDPRTTCEQTNIPTHEKGCLKFSFISQNDLTGQ